MIETNGQTCIILIDSTRIDVVEYYQKNYSEYFKKLPPYLTMNGLELFDVSNTPQTWRMYLDRWRYPDEPVCWATAYQLIPGMKFYTVPPATY